MTVVTKELRKKMDEVKFVLRLKEKSHGKIKREAKKNNTSMNKEIQNIIDLHFNRTPLEKRLASIEELIDKKLTRKK